MKVLIADDELWVRTALESMLLEIDRTLKIVGKAENGQQMVEIAEREQPDLVFVDIRMPQMDGLEGIECAKGVCTDTSWVILSGFSDFPYAQKAITLGVAAYLLKPVDPEKLREVLADIRKRRNQMKKERDTDFQHYLISNFYMMEGRLQRNAQFDSMEVMGMKLYGDTWLGSHLDEPYYEKIHALLLRRIDELGVSGNISSAFFMDGPGKWILAVGVSPGKDSASEEKVRIRAWFLSLQKEIQRVSDKDFSLTGICTGWHRNVTELIIALNQVDQYAYLRILLGMGRVWNAGDLLAQKGELKDTVQEFCQKLELVGKGLRNRSYLNFLGCITAAEKSWADCKHAVSYGDIANMKHYLAVSAGINRILGLDEFRRMEMQNLLALICENAGTILKVTEKEGGERDVVRLTEEYVENHYAEDIGVAQIAEQLDLTPNYLSALFHKKRGITFVKYLTKVRMTRAEELLLNTDLPVNQIAGQVGYTDTRYFAKVFRDSFGFLPSEYGRKSRKE